MTALSSPGPALGAGGSSVTGARYETGVSSAKSGLDLWTNYVIATTNQTKLSDVGATVAAWRGTTDLTPVLGGANGSVLDGLTLALTATNAAGFNLDASASQGLRLKTTAGGVTVSVAQSGGGELTLESAAGITLGAAVSATHVALTASGAVTQSAAITADDLVLRGAGAFTLGQSGNQIGTLAADVGALTLADGADLTIGAVDGLTGVHSAGGVTLSTSRPSPSRRALPCGAPRLC
jgi:hypothetical protein